MKLRTTSLVFCLVLSVFLISSRSASAKTTVLVKPVAGAGYAVDWISISYQLRNPPKAEFKYTNKTVVRKKNLPVGRSAKLVIPKGAVNITIEAKPLGSFRKTRIFRNLRLKSGCRHYFHLRGTVNRPKYKRVSSKRF